ncbi:hypothetical protein AZL_d04210 (plasmid) [Azospirillum sp. B510]|uniref:hypothetical protein n=1 Tax=Azospirillum sp. (strain B510) TaxID=137722 RepID=UPI0001C4CE20|nr:hypothetical protein [Azospirillum sp. B510]BAI76247.1 hypothetical protein AZL_d04210 [Azospirillum sp. B510]
MATVISTAKTTLALTLLDDATLQVDYNTLSGNMPQTYGNYLGIWQDNSGNIPYNQTAQNTSTVNGNTQAGSTTFPVSSLTTNGYVVCFAVGRQLTAPMQIYGNACSTAFLPPNSSTVIYTPGSLTYNSNGSNNLNLNYALPVGDSPSTNGAWVGLWKGSLASYTSAPNVGAAAITSTSSSGIAFINGIALGRGATYTAALFTSGWNAATPASSLLTTMAATVTFQI